MCIRDRLQGAPSFVQHLLQLQASGDPDAFPLPPLDGPRDLEGQRTINLDPALMAYLDQMKREAFIREWENAIVQDE